MNILQDIKTAIKLTGEIRKARKAGASALQVKPVYTVSVYRLSYWGSTMEGCLFYGRKWQPLRDVFDSFPVETQHSLTFAPKNGEWGNRVRFWQEELRDTLEPNLYHEMISTLLRWCIRCRRRELEEVQA